MTIVLQFYPNGEFSQGVDTSSSRPPRCDRKTTQTSTQTSEYTHADILKSLAQTRTIPSSVYDTYAYPFADSVGNTYNLVESENTYCVLKRSDNNTDQGRVRIDTSIHRAVHVGLVFPLVYQSVESCEKSESRKKLTSMSKRMSRNIRNGVYLLEQQPGGKDVLSFLTLTLPNLSTEGLKACCENWDSMVKRFFDWLRLSLRSKGLPLEHVYCTEIQLKRLQTRGEYAPHLHIVFKGRISRKSAWAITPKKARAAWGRCISAYTDEPFETKALENLQRIKYSAARYLSKYLSKGSNIIPESSDGCPISYLKTQWGGMARSISKGIRQATQRFTGRGSTSRIAWSIFNNMERLLEAGLVLYFKRGFIPLHTSNTEGLEHGLHVGCGCLSTPTYKGGCIQLVDYLYKHSLLSGLKEL